MASGCARCPAQLCSTLDSSQHLTFLLRRFKRKGELFSELRLFPGHCSGSWEAPDAALQKDGQWRGRGRDGWRDGRMYRLREGGRDGWMCGWVGGGTDGWRDGWIEGGRGGRMDGGWSQWPHASPLDCAPHTTHPCPPLQFWHFVFKPTIVLKLFSLKLMFGSSPLKQSPSWSQGKRISNRFFFSLSLCQPSAGLFTCSHPCKEINRQSRAVMQWHEKQENKTKPNEDASSC